MISSEVAAFRIDADLNGTFMTASMTEVMNEPQEVRWILMSDKMGGL
jgi:hypothetical protein